ncbi:MAG: hypothetical protein ACK56F_29375, partial [bacterium]
MKPMAPKTASATASQSREPDQSRAMGGVSHAIGFHVVHPATASDRRGTDEPRFVPGMPGRTTPPRRGCRKPTETHRNAGSPFGATNSRHVAVIRSDSGNNHARQDPHRSLNRLALDPRRRRSRRNHRAGH